MTLNNSEQNNVPVVSPWYEIAMYFVGPLESASIQEIRYIITASDHSKKIVYEFSTETKLASNFADAFLR